MRFFLLVILILQILADNIIVKIQHFRVKWVSINHQGNTQEPRKRLKGEKSVGLLNTYRAKKKANQAATKQSQREVIERNLVETGQPSSVLATEVDVVEKSKRPRQTPSAGAFGSVRSRVNESPLRHIFQTHFETTPLPLLPSELVVNIAT